MKQQPLKIYEALRWASSFLTKHELEQPIAEILLMHYLTIDRTKLLQMLQEELPSEVEQAFRTALMKVAQGIPVQHITNVEYFYGRQFSVNENVLIPRPETEELVQGLLQRIQMFFQQKSPLTVVDIGTGSGAIAITLALENPQLAVTSIDISRAALEVAKKNANHLEANVRFLEGDLLQPLIEEKTKVDVVVSNPPYISEADFQLLPKNVREYEPTQALIGGKTGYELYEKLIAQIPYVLQKQGIIAFEVGAGQSNYVEALIKAQFPTAQTEIVDDINGKDRMVFAAVY